MTELTGFSLGDAIRQINKNERKIIEICYAKGSNRNFSMNLVNPVVVRFLQTDDVYKLTVSYF
ncbi:hypothetical protein SAMN02745751_00883 [Dethiosulfatibacter aminovorans DSM 17477]|uniref:Uncharacterized protein n=1 Tax=Dethiosulfatibacter aminovorans DSM 17477 TaxID=1121476 RepID=A0A1M6DEV4_9FIRM|nr:hypothetical protein SAMN02745751_00883 [Dethiosulfatibacter aminovorans DSM 17477]